MVLKKDTYYGTGKEINYQGKKSNKNIEKAFDYLLDTSEIFDVTSKGNPFFQIKKLCVEVNKENATIYCTGKLEKDVIKKLEKIGKN